MVTTRLALGSVSMLALGAILFGSAPYWLNRSVSHAAPWGAISSSTLSDPAATQSDTQRTQLMKLAALKSPTAAEQGTPTPTPTPLVQATAPVNPAPLAQPAVPAPAPPTTAAAASPEPAPVAPASQQVASTPDAAVTDEASSDSEATKAGATGTVNINTASLSTLDHLPGAGRIGHAIVSHRPYKKVKDLVNKRVLRAGDFQKIQSRISVD